MRPCVDTIIQGVSRPVMKVSNLDTPEFIVNFIQFSLIKFILFNFLFYLIFLIVSWIRNNSRYAKNVIKKALT